MANGEGASTFSQLKGIPLEWLVATPLMASARSNIALAQVMVEFINEIGFDKDKPRLLQFTLTRPYQEPNPPNAWQEQSIQVTAPLLGLVPLPALLIQSVSVNLTVKVSTTVGSQTQESTDDTLQASDSWGFGKVAMTGEVKASHTNTRSSDYSATYTVNVLAEQQQETEGMNKLMDVMASVIQPLPTASSGGGGS